MLEAFEASGTRPAKPAGPARGGPSAPSAASPAGPKPSPAAPPSAASAASMAPVASVPRVSRAELSAPVATEAGFTLPFSAPTFLLVQLGLLGVAFFLGHEIGIARQVAAAPDEVQTANGGYKEDPGSAATPDGGTSRADLSLSGTRRGEGAPGPAVAPIEVPVEAQLSPEKAAFLDPRNRFAVQAASYAGSQRELAEYWLDQLREAGFPALIHPVGSKLSIYVGADEIAVELDAMVGRVRSWRAPDGSQPFYGCRIVGLEGLR